MFEIASFLLDAVILIALVVILARERLAKFPRVVLVSLGIAGVYFVCDLFGTWLPGHLLVVPLVIFSGIVLMVYGRLRLKQAAAVSGLSFVFHVVLAAILGWFS